MSQTRNELHRQAHESEIDVYERGYINPEDDHPGWASGVKPLRGPVDHELTRETRVLNPEIVHWLARNDRLSLEEQTTGPGIEALPHPDEVDRDTDRPRNIRQRARMLSSELLHMPHPKYRWTTYILHHSFRIPVAKLEQASLLVKSGEIQPYLDKPGSTVVIWRVDPVPYEHALEDYLNSSRFPCGHTGVRNYGDGEYGCSEDACPAIYPRATAEDVMWGDDNE